MPTASQAGGADRQAGFAVPTVLMMLLAVTAIVGVAITSAVYAQRGVTRDSDSKAGLLVAEGGVSQALLHYNRVPTTPAQPCVVTTGSMVTTAATTNGWCPASTGSLHGEAFTYVVRPTAGAIQIVSTGDADGVTRRVDVDAVSSSGQNMFTNATVKAQDWIHVNSEAEILSGVATNGEITMASNAKICGSASVGVGRTMTTASNAAWYDHYTHPDCVTQLDPADIPQVPMTLPPVNQGDAATNNDNARFFGQDLISGHPSHVCFNGMDGDGTSGSCGARELSISSNNAVTLSGDTYSFCKLTLNSNTSLFIAAGATVRIYFDSPEACGLAAGTAQLQLDSNSRITSTAGGPTNVGMYFVGSSSESTTINLASNTQVAGDCEQNFVIYAPRTAINMNSNSVYCGALAGKTITIDSGANVYGDAGAGNFVLPNATPHYVVSRFAECTLAGGAQPDSGC